MKILSKLCISIAYVLLIYTFINVYRADIYAKRAERLLKNIELEQASASALTAIKLNPNEPYYYRVLAKIYITKAITNKEYKNKTLELLEQALSLNENNLATIRNNAPIYYYLALNGVEQGNLTIDKNYIHTTAGYMAKYKKIYPTDLGLLVLFAKHEKKLQLDKNYNESIELIRKLRPDVLTWYKDL